MNSGVVHIGRACHEVVEVSDEAYSEIVIEFRRRESFEEAVQCRQESVLRRQSLSRSEVSKFSCGHIVIIRHVSEPSKTHQEMFVFD